MLGTLSIGDEVGRYRIEKRLGGGASGTVYLAYDTTLDARVALKVLRARREGDDESFHRFKRELKNTRALTHPGICRVFDLQQEGDLHFITMEYVEGSTLQEIIEHEGHLSIRRTFRLLRAICRALRAAHRAGVVHRDLKPGNVMVTPKDRPVILDFGLALTAEDTRITKPGVAVGTPLYMAPEVLLGHSASPSTDLYAVGVMLYRCLTGRFPYNAYDIPALIEAHSNARPMPPHRYNPDISQDLSDLVMRALASSPAVRFESAKDFEAALAELDDDVADHEGSSSGPWNREVETTVRVVAEHMMRTGSIRQRIKSTTVFFSDIVGITAYFDEKGDVAGMQLLQQHNQLLIPIVRDHGGEVVKTIGDAIMAIFPAAASGVAAAREMQRTLFDYNSQDDTHDPIHIRIGLHSGKAIVKSRDVFGDTVNVAARICAKAEPDQILVSSTTEVGLPTDIYEIEIQGEVELKGKREPVTMYAVDWREPAEGAEHGTMVIPRESPPDTPRIVGSPPRSYALRITAGAAAALGVALVVAVYVQSRGGLPESPSSPPVREAVETSSSSKPGPASPNPDSDTAETPEDDSKSSDRIADDPAPVATARVRDVARDKAKVVARKRRQILESAMRERGVIAGDHAPLDSARRDADRQYRQGKYAAATSSSDRALEVLGGIAVDRAFVDAKLGRFNRHIRTNSNSELDEKVQPLVDRMVKAYGLNEYARTNRILNRAFAVLAAEN